MSQNHPSRENPVAPFRRARGSAVRFIYPAALLSLAYVLIVLLAPWPDASLRKEMAEASRLMEEAAAMIRECRHERGVPVDSSTDVNRTGLVGIETSPLTTSLGHLGAKRTTTNPNMAGLVVLLLEEVGVRRGDVVAVGASSSFPGSIVATLAAMRAMGVEPLLISSLGASQWGANDPAFDWLAVEDCLLRKTDLPARPLALALGGDEDVGRDMSPETVGLLRARVLETGIPFIEEPELEANVGIRMRIYRNGAGRRPIQAFVNVGGSFANMGTNSEVLKLRPGVAGEVFIPPPEERGVIQAMAAERVPVIHLLNIRGLCERYGLPWDPKPLPRPGEGEIYRIAATKETWFLVLSAAYFAGLALIVLISGKIVRFDTVAPGAAGNTSFRI
jgi:poly-gamma-glutamate system protein